MICRLFRALAARLRHREEPLPLAPQQLNGMSRPSTSAKPQPDELWRNEDTAPATPASKRGQK
jgi:hypothetical protein